MRLLLGSGGFRTNERRAQLVRAMQEHFGPVRRVLFVPYALVDHERYLEIMKQAGLDAGYELDGIHRHDDPVRAVEEAEAISVGGGNTWLLTDALHRLGLIEVVRRRVLEDGVPYMGVSAGSNVACPTMMTTNDMPVVQPPSFEAFGLVPFQINAHYYPGMIHVKEGEQYHEHYGETRDDRIREFHEHHAQPVVGLWESGFLRVADGELRLEGAPARVFRPGAEPADHAPGARLDSLLAAT